MAGKRRVLVFSQAGGTGRSYHADLAADNQQRRVLYCVEPGWSSARCVQGMGRVHRANQACAPELVLVTTNLKAQRRFLSHDRQTPRPARRAHERAAPDGEPGPALVRVQPRDALGTRQPPQLVRGPLPRRGPRRRDAGVTPALVEEQMGIRVLDADGQLNVGSVPDVPKFLNRLLSLRTGAMDAVFDSWHGYLAEARETARDAGTLDVGVETVQAERVEKTAERLVYTHERTGAETHVVTLDVTRRTVLVDWQSAWMHAARGAGRLRRLRREPAERARLPAAPRRQPHDRDRTHRAAAAPHRRPLEPALDEDRGEQRRGRRLPAAPPHRGAAALGGRSAARHPSSRPSRCTSSPAPCCRSGTASPGTRASTASRRPRRPSTARPASG